MSRTRQMHQSDASQAAIVDALRQHGAVVHCLAGKGIPDLLVGYHRRTFLFECKNGPKSPMTPAQREFMRTWTGSPVWVVTKPEEALDVLDRLAQVVQPSSAWEEAWHEQSKPRPVLPAGQDTGGV